ncbi:segregation/condensation protein A [Cyanobacterium stanieri LEGE 03274]|uniref:Segregation and condensation protein A n=1 Tax=Cyanobacterium stanieri LEGE 03274 TaxID=1828756 RepID=A0ABR9V705_9CHRO|nr:segregation/condensation protein A [Cyanobacterium stanieri]MBE9223688.1 segregation/condensation protein A [Cyanobacterium stanieri LEGE 03274]
MKKNSPASEAIATLIDLAQKGEINPWDVQVIEIIDRFLAELNLQESNTIDIVDQDLSHSGQVMLWASMLVLLKAETLEKLGQKEIETEEIYLEEDLENSLRKRNLQPNLEQQIKRRTSALPPRKRRVTLSEFITQLQDIEKELQKATNLHGLNLNKKRKYTKKQALKTITELAHDENLTQLAQDLNLFLNENFSLISDKQKQIKLQQLVISWSQYQEKPKQDKVGVFWALLLLSSQSKVQLSQEDFYQDINIEILNQNLDD